MFDEAIHTPLIWSWPGRVPALNTQVAPVSSYDLFPTLCAAANASVPDRNLCGRSYLPLATGKPFPKKQSWRPTVFGHYQNTDMARTARYELVLRADGAGPNELYDLPADAGERINQADNPQYVAVKNVLGGELAQWKRQYSG
jgi:arylsulfatase A-like enzyme